jgi:hypothetical protein
MTRPTKEIRLLPTPWDCLSQNWYDLKLLYPLPPRYLTIFVTCCYWRVITIYLARKWLRWMLVWIYSITSNSAPSGVLQMSHINTNLPQLTSRIYYCFHILSSSQPLLPVYILIRYCSFKGYCLCQRVTIYWAHLSMFHLQTETESGLWNVMFQIKDRTILMSRIVIVKLEHQLQIPTIFFYNSS